MPTILLAVVTVVLILWNCYKYSLDEDLATVQFTKFHSSKDRFYPAITLCFDVEPVSQKSHYTEDNPQKTIIREHIGKQSILLMKTLLMLKLVL